MNIKKQYIFTTNTSYQQYTSQSRRIHVLLRRRSLTTVSISSTSPLLVLSIPETHSQVYVLSDLQRLFDLNMKIHFKTRRKQRPRAHPGRTYRRSYRLYQQYTLPLWCIRVPLFLHTAKSIHFISTRPHLVLSTPEKHYKFFGYTKTV